MPAEPEIRLEEETPESCHAFFRQLRQDPLLFADEKDFRPYRYRHAAVEADFARRFMQRDRRAYTVFRGERVIGQVQLKHIDPERRSCELSICLINESVKNRGYGTRAERLALRLAFEELGLETVTASVLAKNSRSEHVLQKLGFRYVSEDADFRQFVINRERFAAFSRHEDEI